MVTATAILTRIGRIDFDQLIASLCRFAYQLREKGRPRGVTDRFREAMVMEQTIDGQVLHTDKAEAVHDLSALLMREVLAPERDALMDTCNRFPMFASLRCPLCQFRVFLLHLCQCLLFFPEEAGIFYLCPIGEGRKGFQSHVNTDLGRSLWQPLRLAFDGKADRPLAGTAPVNGTGFDGSLDGAMIDHLERANLRKTETVVMGRLVWGTNKTEPFLWKGKTVIAALPFETGVSRFLAYLETTKEDFHGKVKAYRDVLQDLRVYRVEGWALLFQYRIGVDLPVTGESLAGLCVRFFALFQQVVVEPAALFKGGFQGFPLFLCRVEPILKGFYHTAIIAQVMQTVKSA